MDTGLLLLGACASHEAAAPPAAVCSHPPVPEADALPLSFPEIEFVTKMGSGTYGCVWHARDRATGDSVAIKVCKRRIHKTDVSDNIHAEFATQCAVTHPHILRPLRLLEGPHELALVMPLVQNSDGGCPDMSASWARLDRSEAGSARIAAQLLSALASLHGSGIVHRDVKCENVLVDQGNNVLLVDFGFAIDTSTRRPSSAVGTLSSMAPELLLAHPSELPVGAKLRRDASRTSRSPYSSAVDVWAFGVLMSEYMTGRSPLMHVRTPEAAVDALAAGPEVILPEDFSADAVDFLSSCFELDPCMRLTAWELFYHPWIRAHVDPPTWHELHPSNFVHRANRGGVLHAESAASFAQDVGSLPVEGKQDSTLTEGRTMRNSRMSAFWGTLLHRSSRHGSTPKAASQRMLPAAPRRSQHASDDRAAHRKAWGPGRARVHPEAAPAGGAPFSEVAQGAGPQRPLRSLASFWTSCLASRSSGLPILPA